jgi:hypothetical protein
MTPSLPIATDNIYKFTCLFGLALIIVSIFSFVSMYTATLDRKVEYSQVIISLEAKEQRSKAADALLELNRNLLEVTKANGSAGNTIASAALGTGIVLSLFGAFYWYKNIQLRDDKLAQLQIEKLEAEILKLRAETPPENVSDFVSTVNEEVNGNAG